MGRIRMLDDRLINRIAAGEVVERPASVLKELVENSLDSGARSITVRLSSGGRTSILVEDDGCGMDRDDALLAVERHATSKVGSAADLDTIATLGFRGEALASIAAVSHFTLRTAQGDGEGTELQIEGGRVVAVRSMGLPAGTSVRVDHLFYNVPARRKFLRSEATELSQSLRAVTRLALAHPECRFALYHGARNLIDVQPTADPLGRLLQIYGRDVAGRLLPFDARLGTLRVHGWAGRPADSLPQRDQQHLFVNRRAVQDRLLSHAVAQAYTNTQVPGRYPVLVLFIEIEPAEVDVNVHPQKVEVRFSRPSQVHDGVRDAIAGALKDARAVPTLTELRPAGSSPWHASTRESALGFIEAHGGEAEQPHGPRDACREGVSPAYAVAEPGLGRESWARVVPLGQIHDSYIVAEDGQGLVLIDQHAAHERVLFEQFMKDAETDSVAVQQLMFPLTFELAPHELVLLEAEISEFTRLGFRLEPFGGNAVRLDGVPALAGALEPEALFRELLGEAARCRAAATGLTDLRRRVVTTAACHAAIKIHHPMGREVMQRLLDDLYRTENPTTCPHGRPALFRLTLPEIERAFRRI